MANASIEIVTYRILFLRLILVASNQCYERIEGERIDQFYIHVYILENTVVV